MNERFDCAAARFDRENAGDPNLESDGGADVPRELLYARRLTAWVLRLAPEASEVLRLAARCQHLGRWQVPRGDFPADRAGYHRWRNTLKRFHADAAGKILQECGYGPEVIAAVRRLNLKEGFPGDPESRVLEDALCLVFLEFQLESLAARTERAKIVNALRKSWEKMTEHGRQAALGLRHSEPVRALLEEALAAPPPRS